MALNQDDLDNLENLIKKINTVYSGSNVDNEILAIFVADNNLVRLLHILNQVKKINISKILKSIEQDINKTNVANKVKSNHIFTKDEIINIFSNLSEDEVAKQYELYELEQMHISVLGCKPLSKNKRKKNIVNSISNYLYRIERANAFKS